MPKTHKIKMSRPRGLHWYEYKGSNGTGASVCCAEMREVVRVGRSKNVWITVSTHEIDNSEAFWIKSVDKPIKTSCSIAPIIPAQKIRVQHVEERFDKGVPSVICLKLSNHFNLTTDTAFWIAENFSYNWKRLWVLIEMESKHA